MHTSMWCNVHQSRLAVQHLADCDNALKSKRRARPSAGNVPNDAAHTQESCDKIHVLQQFYGSRDVTCERLTVLKDDSCSLV